MAAKNLNATFTGTVTPFSGKGRALGYPTANISKDTELADGVYFGFANLANFQDHPALIFIGTPTTVGDHDRRIEAHLLDIKDQDYYGLELKLTLSHYSRPSQTFQSLAELITAMKNDEATARQWFDAQKSKQKITG